MERNFRRISDELKLPPDSRERIRSQLSSYENLGEDIPMKKRSLQSRIPPLVAAAVVAAMALTLTAGAAVVTRLFRNDIIVSSVEDARAAADKAAQDDDVPWAYSVSAPNGSSPSTLAEITESYRFKSDDWETGERINGSGGSHEYFKWDSAEVLSSDPSLRSRRVSRADGAEKMEYTAENPVNLLDTLTDRVTFDLSWMEEHYDYVPDANLSLVVTDAVGNYVSECFQALYAKPDESGYIRVEVCNTAEENNNAPSYIIEGSYETAYYYTSADGYPFLIEMHNGRVWVMCETNHTSINLYGAYLTCDEVEDILDHLSLSTTEKP